MTFTEKINYLNRFIRELGSGSGTVAQVLFDTPFPPVEYLEMLQMLEVELINTGLGKPFSSNSEYMRVQGGWILFQLSDKAINLVRSGDSVKVLYPKEAQMYDMFELIQLVKSTGGEIEMKACLDRLKLDEYRIRKYAGILEDCNIFKIRDASSKDGGEFYYSLDYNGDYASKNIHNMNEVISDSTKDTSYQNISYVNIGHMGDKVKIGDNNNIEGTQIGGKNNTNNPKGNDDPLTGAVQKRMSNFQLTGLILTAISIVLTIIIYWDKIFG